MSAPHQMPVYAMWNEKNQSAKEAAMSHGLIFVYFAQNTMTMTFEPFIFQWLISKTTKIFGCRRSRNHYLKVEINYRIYFTICCFSQLSKCQAFRAAQPLSSCTIDRDTFYCLHGPVFISTRELLQINGIKMKIYFRQYNFVRFFKANATNIYYSMFEHAIVKSTVLYSLQREELSNQRILLSVIYLLLVFPSRARRCVVYAFSTLA